SRSGELEAFPVDLAAKFVGQAVELLLQGLALEAGISLHHEQELALDELGLLADDLAAAPGDQIAVHTDGFLDLLGLDTGDADETGHLLLEQINDHPADNRDGNGDDEDLQAAA